MRFQNTITVRASGIASLQRLAKDIDKVVSRINGRTFKVFVEPALDSQVPRMMTLGQAMSFATELLRQHHISQRLKPDVDSLGTSERALVKQFVAKHAGLSRPKRGGAGLSLREQAQQAIGQAQRILPGNRALAATQAALAGKRTFKL